ncbi:MAG TPA: MFS transporter [Dongiaceae bacterium]|nr:MFS transporter [Dongiaceae bacterium]
MVGEQPVWLRAVTRPGAAVFGLMFALESLARAVLAALIPLQAYAILKEARDVSLTYFAVAIFGFFVSFAIPFFIRRFRRRWVYTAGVVMLILSAICLATFTFPGQIAAMVLRSVAAASLNITLSLYVLDYIRKRDLVRSEPLKLLMSAFSWTLGPSLGVYLYNQVGYGSAEMLSGGASLTLLVYFWYLRIKDNPAVAAASRPAPNPFKSIRRFVSQPRLRLGWIIPFSRSCWWSMFFVYPQIYMVQHGKGELAAAIVLSLGNAVLFGVAFIGRLAQRRGIRPLIIAAFIGSGCLTVAAGFTYDWPWVTAGLLLLGALCVMVLDGLGNIPFLRAVKPLERPQMATVFRTYIDLSDLLPAALYSGLLSYFDIRSVFFACGLWMLIAAVIARHLPRSM